MFRAFRLRADPAPPADLAHKSHEEAVGRARTRDDEGEESRMGPSAPGRQIRVGRCTFQARAAARPAV